MASCFFTIVGAQSLKHDKATNSATNEVRYITKTFDGAAVSSEAKVPLWIANQIVTSNEI